VSPSKTKRALASRVKAWEESPNGPGGFRIGPSENRNQRTHRPGSQNRKKGYGQRSGRH